MKAIRNKDKLIRQRIMAWYRRYRRDLQWRTTTDPYEILVSEIMLQQTQVARVKKKLPRFLAAFPAIEALAAAKPGDVLRAWKGMGYNNRAVRLHKLARIVVERRHGIIPTAVDDLLGLPGIGRYTAHAVACFAHRQCVPVVDVNILRVLSRLYYRMPSLEIATDEKLIWEKAAAILPRNAFDWNQALMDLGATVCTARAPQCDICPVQKVCTSAKALAGIRPVANNRRQTAGASREPMYAGIPRRFWRGRIVEELRKLKPGRSISLPRLGIAVKYDFGSGDLPWLNEVAGLLAKDGVIRLRRYRSQFHVALIEE